MKAEILANRYCPRQIAAPLITGSLGFSSAAKNPGTGIFGSFLSSFGRMQISLRHEVRRQLGIAMPRLLNLPASIAIS